MGSADGLWPSSAPSPNGEPMHLSTEEWGLLTACAPIVLSAVVGYRRFDKRTTKLEENTATLRPNGGSSVADSIRRSEVKLDSIAELLANLTGRFEQHLSEVESSKQEWNQWRLSQETSRSKPRRSSERTLHKSNAD